MQKERRKENQQERELNRHCIGVPLAETNVSRTGRPLCESCSADRRSINLGKKDDEDGHSWKEWITRKYVNMHNTKASEV